MALQIDHAATSHEAKEHDDYVLNVKSLRPHAASQRCANWCIYFHTEDTFSSIQGLKKFTFAMMSYFPRDNENTRPSRQAI
jgi:hypothetical protein